MSNATKSTLTEEQPIRLRVRRDLKISQQTHQGLTWWVIKDPLSLRYSRMRSEQFAILQMLDGRCSLAELKQRVTERFPHLSTSYSQLQSLLIRFHQQGLVTSETRGQGGQLLFRHQKQRRKALLSTLLSVFAIRFPGVDPDRFLAWSYSKLHWLFSPVFVGFCGILIISAIALIMSRFDLLVSRLPNYHQFFGAGNFVWMMVALAGAKVLHELGHGLACKHFGGECHQIGLMLLVFTPCLYCDTSDSWMVRSKWQRAAIGAAGMAVELVLASVCTFVWWNTTPGLLHYLCLNTIFVCSVSTLIFNCNPLLRYDGYYILSDLVEVPNLGHKSRQAVKAAIQHYCLGLPWGRSALYPVRQRWLFIVYGIASASYKWIVLFAILRFVSTVFAPYGLQPVGELLIALSLCSLIGIPIWQAYQFFKTPGKIAQVQRSHITVASCFAAVILAIVVFVPLPHHVLATVTLQPRNATSVYVEVGGVLDEVLVEPGDVVAADTPLAHVTDVTVQFDTEKLRGQQQRLATKLRNLQRQQSDDDSVDQAIPHTQAALENIQERLQRVTARQDRLTLTAPIAGAVISPPTVPPASTASAELATWSGNPLEPMNRGSWLEAGTLFCLIGQPTDLEAVAVIEQSDADFVRMDQTVRIKLDEFPTHTWHGRVSEIAVIDLEVAPRELTSKAGGGLDTTTDASGAERPAKVSYQARIPLDDSDARLLAGVRGHARIRVGYQTLARRLARLLFKTFRIV